MYSELSDLKHSKSEPQEEPLNTREFIPTKPQITQRSEVNYYESKNLIQEQGTGITAAPSTSVSEIMQMRPNLSYGKMTREGVVKGNLKLTVNQSYGQMECQETDTPLEYDYVCMQ